MAICKELKEPSEPEESDNGDSDHDDETDECEEDPNREWAETVVDLLYMEMAEVTNFEIFQPASDGLAIYTKSSVSRSFIFSRRIFFAIVTSHVNDLKLCKPWYYRNGVWDEMGEWGMDIEAISRLAMVDAWGFQMHTARLDFDPSSPDVLIKDPERSPDDTIYTQARANTRIVSWWLSLLTRILDVKWTRLVPPPALGPRPIVLKAMLRDAYEALKEAALKTIENLIMTADMEEAEASVYSTLSDENPDYIISYPKMRVTDQRRILSFPQKEIFGSGLVLARKLGLRVPNSSDALPSKYFQGNPGVGDIPLHDSFPFSFSEFSNDDLFWLVVFYNDSFALQCRDRSKAASEHVFEVWWHLSYMATHEGELPEDGTFERLNGEPEGAGTGEHKGDPGVVAIEERNHFAEGMAKTIDDLR